ncbi:MAG TPA: Asp-tRNA(Asn)/Glu-tRNA(Gln) amidotransferase GatCAB subunit B [Candidatus Peribacter riflensis]|nr:Asp-tRNA(Asn)/Glu-tRNA(Gln) amidotransferase GatCAB subunit B [Candidatus Peribacter riflensis]HBU10006.1 Asp-tRNA(Asn)/Glu-tRNA(Gln) amidotransferase GatCAB subunit B [Candidatus Peribacter riflensis]
MAYCWSIILKRSDCAPSASNRLKRLRKESRTRYSAHMPELEAVIGLEVHAQMSTKTKMFCGCDNDAFGKAPNTTVCPICMGFPGTLPVPNKEAIAKAVRMALALRCTVAADCHFDRKHYFYPDLPAGFQISQYDFPLAKGGSVEYDLTDDGGNAIGERSCRITRLHMENDAGKLSHYGSNTLCDYNRAGTPLMEIVTEPDLTSAEEAVAFAQELRRILISVGASDADMFKGMMRFDASISLKEKGTAKLNPRSEIKNLNSFKALEKALQYEEKRLRDLWEKDQGPLPHDITVGWMDEGEKTQVLRDKETAGDYRYFPEPDLPPLSFEAAESEKIQSALPPLPRTEKKKLSDLGLTNAEAEHLNADPDLKKLYEVVLERLKDPKRTSGIVITQLTGFLKAAGKTVRQGPGAQAMLDLVDAIESGKISGSKGKEVLQKMVETGKPASEIIADEGISQITDEGALASLVEKAIAANPKAVESFKNGKTQALGAIVGWVMKETRGQASPEKVNEILLKKIA